ncbi:hypothetical protein Tco_0009386 [Tanacetum coccineum]
MVAYLQKSEGSEGFHHIVDFLTTSHIRYALTKSPTISVSLIEQFWQTATASTLENGDMEIIATIDGKVKTVSEVSIRRHLKLEDSEESFQGIYWGGHSIVSNNACLRDFIRHETEVLQPSSPTQTHVADEAASIGVDDRHGGAATTVSGLEAGQDSGNINKTPTMPHDSHLPRVHTLRSDEGRMQQNELTELVTKLTNMVEVLENDLKQTKKVYGVAFTKLIKKGRKIVEIDEDPDISLYCWSAERQVYIRMSAAKRKDKGKAIMKEDESIQKKTKLQLEQERLGYEEALRLQEQLDEDEG